VHSWLRKRKLIRSRCVQVWGADLINDREGHGFQPCALGEQYGGFSP